jgi:hypothetical protein
MPGPQDRWDQPPGSPEATLKLARQDSPRRGDLSGRGPQADLRYRLEQLPVGHPSSPYNDDGTRKPPVPRLRQLELPLERDSGSWPSLPSRDSQPREANGDGQPRQANGDGQPGLPTRAGQPGLAADDSPPGLPRRDVRQPATLPIRVGQASLAVEREGTSRPDGAADAAAGDGPTSAPDGSWDWRGTHLTPELSRAAESALDRCREAEGRNVFGSYAENGLTPAMRRIEASLEHGQLVPDTDALALKPADRFREKLARIADDEPRSDPDALATSIHDGVRYTYLFDAANYVRGVLQARSALEEQGNELLTLRNTWDSEESKGISGRWRQQSSDQLFEVQFHTHESWEAKQRTHQAHEEITSKATTTADKERLRAYQREVSASVPVPSHAPMIADYRKVPE